MILFSKLVVAIKWAHFNLQVEQSISKKGQGQGQGPRSNWGHKKIGPTWIN